MQADDEAFAKLLMEEENKKHTVVSSPPKNNNNNAVLSDAEYAAKLFAEENNKKYNDPSVDSDAQIARLMHEKQELEQRLLEAQNMPKETVIDVSSVDYPDYWYSQSTPFQSFDVPKGSDEWNRVQYRFQQGLPGTHITRIERIQNKNLWLWFYLKRKELEAKNSSTKGANEKHVFHGSRANAYDIILKEGFDHRVAHMGGAFGAGIYFAESSQTSSGYVAAASHRKMLFCRVLVGDLGPGKSGLRRPPEKKTFFGKSVLYDSVGTENSVYVVFDNNQCYPEYVIHY